jgi:hypothetical protein
MLMERIQAYGWFEGMLFARFAAQQPVVRTLAWPGDDLTVQPRPENYGDMHGQLAEVKSDVVLAGYGFNESSAGAAGVAKLEADLAALGRAGCKPFLYCVHVPFVRAIAL